MKREFITIMAVAFAVVATAQEKTGPDYGNFTVDAQVRAYGEYLEGTVTNGSTEHALSVNERARFSLGWERKNVSMKITGQHIGFWQKDTHKSTSGKFALHEAWAKLTFGKGFLAQVGRQELAYDDERLLGAHDWVSSGRTHDALRLGWENPWHKVHAIAGFNQTAEEPDPLSGDPTSKLYKNMEALWYHYGASQSPFQISGIFINQGVNDVWTDSIRYMQTFGVYMTYEKSNITADASLYYQMGRDRTDKKTSAYMLSANFGWQFLPQWKVSVGDDYLSGSDGMPGKNRTFNLLYGSYHNFLGDMDNFAYYSIPYYGLNDAHARVDFNCCPKFDVTLAYHWFITGRPINNYLKDPIEPIIDPAKILIMRKYHGKHRFSQNLGGEVDLQLSYRPWKNVTLQAGFGMMISSETMRFLRSIGKYQKWGWVGFNVNPTIFTTRRN